MSDVIELAELPRAEALAWLALLGLPASLLDEPREG
jgi:hypothetical protein